MTLKPCPFCGGEAELESVWFWEEWRYYVHCTQCHIRTATYCYDEEEAIEAWNARVPESYIRVRDDSRNFQDLLKDDLYVKAADLPDLGYVKVVRCGECRWWRQCECPECRKSKSPIMACGNPDIIDIPVRGEFDYCSAGEAKEDTNA